MAKKKTPFVMPSLAELPEMVLISDEDLIVRYANLMALESFKWKEKDILNKPLKEFVRFCDEDNLQEIARLENEKIHVFEEILLAATGEEFRVMVRVRPFLQEGVKHYLWVFADYTEELESRQEMIDFMAELSRAKSKIQDYAGRIEVFKRIVNTINQGLIVVDPEGYCFFHNTMADDIFSIDHEELISETELFGCISHPGDLPLASQDDLISALEKGPLRGEVLILDRAESREVRCYLTIFKVHGDHDGDDMRVWNLVLIEEELDRQQRFIDFSAELTALNRQLREKSDEILRISRLDTMTGAYNRNHILALLEEAIQSRKGSEEKNPFTLILFDIDDFKMINDVYGHLFGDNVLCRLTKAVMDKLGNTSDESASQGWLGRYGGEEFLILLNEMDDQEASGWANDLLKEINMIPCNFKTKKEKLGVSLGVTQLRADDTVDDLLHRADMAMYRGKKQGKNQVVLAEE